MRHRLDIRALLALWIALLLTLSLACGRPGASADGDEDGEEQSAQEETDSDKKTGDGEDEEDEEEAVPVEVVALERGPIETVLRFSTNLEAENDVQVVSRATRQLQVRQLLVEEGAEVGRGQVLLRLENAELRTALARIEGQLAKARREYDRQTSLYGQQLISEQAYNDATYELEQLELALTDAQRELGYTEVRAPISGTVTERHVSLGDQVTANQDLFRIVDFDSIVARVYVPEKDLARVSEGLEARLYAESARDVERRGNGRSGGAAGRSPKRHRQGDRRHPARRPPAAGHVRVGGTDHGGQHRGGPGAQEGSDLRYRADLRLPACRGGPGRAPARRGAAGGPGQHRAGQRSGRG